MANELDDELLQGFGSNTEQLEKTGLSGCILIQRGDKVLVRNAYGYADRSAKTKNTSQMRFDIGSVTKPVVSAAVISLVDDGKLRLDSKLGELLSDVPEDKNAITIEQLLSHTSGISRQYEFGNVDGTDRDDVVQTLLRQPLSKSPGDQHEYSNANYFLLAAILDSIGEQSYEDVVRDSVFRPLKMKTAGFTGETLKAGQVSPVRYQQGRAVRTMANWPHTWGHRGATGVLCSGDDLLAFVRAVHTDQLFNAALRKKWLTVRDSHYALGWSVLQQPNKPKVIVHGGSSIGARSILAYYPDADVTLVVLLNSVDGKVMHEWSVLRAVSAMIHKHKLPL